VGRGSFLVLAFLFSKKQKQSATGVKAYKNYDKKLNRRDGERNKRKHKGFLLFLQKIGFAFVQGSVVFFKVFTNS
jgi:hypothetical protein